MMNERSREIFRQIVETYLANGEPVGSRHLSRLLPMALSPASVRNVMQDLEELGLIYAPHTSAGRLADRAGAALLRRRHAGDRRSRARGARARSRRRSRPPRRTDAREACSSDAMTHAVRADPRRRRRRHDQGKRPPETDRIRAARVRSARWPSLSPPTDRSKTASCNRRVACRRRPRSMPAIISMRASPAAPSARPRPRSKRTRRCRERSSAN